MDGQGKGCLEGTVQINGLARRRSRRRRWVGVLVVWAGGREVKWCEEGEGHLGKVAVLQEGVKCALCSPALLSPALLSHPPGVLVLCAGGEGVWRQ